MRKYHLTTSKNKEIKDAADEYDVTVVYKDREGKLETTHPKPFGAYSYKHAIEILEEQYNLKDKIIVSLDIKAVHI